MTQTPQCETCGEFMYRGKKFNMRKEDVHGCVKYVHACVPLLCVFTYNIYVCICLRVRICARVRAAFVCVYICAMRVCVVGR